MLAMNITGGLPGSSVDGTIVYKVGKPNQQVRWRTRAMWGPCCRSL